MQTLKEKTMNCVVICCDTFRYDMLNHDVVKTPHLDRLVQSGITFTNAFAEGLPTIQARRAMFSGIRSYPWRFAMDSRGLWPPVAGWHRVPSEQTTLAEHLWEHGVVTGLVGDTYHMFKSTQNFVRGMCSWSFIRGQESDNVRSGPRSRVDVTPHLPPGVEKCSHLEQYLLNMLDRHTEEDYLPARVFRRASAWLEENHENAPWFLWIDSFAPHEYWDPPMEFADMYYRTDKSRNFIVPQVINDIDPSEEQIERTKALYYGYVTFVDKWIGRFLDKLEQLHMMDDTAILFTSDHGTELWDKGRFGKGGDRLYGYNTRVPLVVKLPGNDRANTTRDDFVQHFDLFPAISTLMGHPPGAELGLDGRDFVDPARSAPDRIVMAWDNNVSVRDTRWNLILNGAGEDEPRELYDLQRDPDETRNVFAMHPNVVKDFTAFLELTLGAMPYEPAHRGDRRHCPPNVHLLPRP